MESTAILAIIFAVAFLVVMGVMTLREEKHRHELKRAREDAVARSRATIEGKVFEQLIPHFPEWKYTPSDARFLSSPLDYVVFSGLSTNTVNEIIFVEVKRGGSTSKRQNSVRKAIADGRVRYELLEIKDGS